jgi:hypothetical protein
MKLILQEKFEAYGHKNIRGTHKTTLEFTKDRNLSKNGDCIIGIRSQRSCLDLRTSTKIALHSSNKFLVRIAANHLIDEFIGYGNPKLLLRNKEDMVFRKSNFICDRTIMVSCTKAAKDINRNLINLLKDSETKITVEIFSIIED